MIPVSQLNDSYRSDFAAQIRLHRTATEGLAVAGLHFLKAAFPLVDERRISALCDAWVNWQCYADELQLKALESESSHSHVTPETLVYLTKERDNLASQIEQAETAIQALANTQSDEMRSLAGIMTASMIAPLSRQLEHVEEQLSAAQNELEQQANV